ncbi:Plasmodium vivax Vir protein, putative [Plasmodium vivax]|uniref:Vir protein, putative n=1 Tax=Plasmodium vivax TaxID=5855 RepID=A0A1G4E7L1_PLAVI|nr:Plasmodium vivax Vir protein, putative [Plasmodium vivax]
MSSGPIFTDFSKLYGKSTKEFYSEKFYDAMDMESPDLKNYEQICNNIQVNIKEKEKMIPVCKKYLRFLDTSKLWSGLFWKFDVSLLLNYWLYDNITHIYGTTQSDIIGIGFGALQLIWSTFNTNQIEKSYREKCKPEPKMVNHEDWKNRKKLYDYYVDFDTLFGQSRIFFNNTCEAYHQKIKEMIPLCTYFERKCSPPGSYSCPEMFYICREKNLETELENLPCHEEIKSRGDSNSEGDTMNRPPVPKLASQSRGDDTGLQGHAASTEDTQLTPKSSDIGTKVSHSVLGAAPVLLTATMLYRVPGFVGSVEAGQIV